MKRMLSIALLGMSFSVFAAGDGQPQLPQPGALLQGPGQQALALLHQQQPLPEGNWADALVTSASRATSTSLMFSIPLAGLALAVGEKRGSFAIPLAFAVGSYGANSVLWGLQRELSPAGAAKRDRRATMINGVALLGVGAFLFQQYS